MMTVFELIFSISFHRDTQFQLYMQLFSLCASSMMAMLKRGQLRSISILDTYLWKQVVEVMEEMEGMGKKVEEEREVPLIGLYKEGWKPIR